MAILLTVSLWAIAAPDTVTIRPTAAGDETNLTPNTGANYAAAGEATSDNDTTYVYSSSPNYATDLYNLGDITVSGKGKINSVTAYINARASATPNRVSAYTRIKTNGTAYNGTAETLTTGYANYSTAYSTNPQTTAEWTWLEINNLQAGSGLKRPTAAAGTESRVTQVWVVVDYTMGTLESYKEASHSTVWGTVQDPYDSASNTVYMSGANYIASHSYAVAYYDGIGDKIQTDNVTSTAANVLDSQYLLPSNPSAAEGTWHAVVFDPDLGTPPTTYSAASTAAGYMGEDAFEVVPTAIPEFPTVMAGLAVAAFCFVIYYQMRKRSPAQLPIR